MKALYGVIAGVTVLWSASATSAELPLYRIMPIEEAGATLSVEDLNNSGEVVGTADEWEGQRAFSWKNGRVTQLQPLIAPDNSSAQTDATGINDQGTIVGSIYTDHYSGYVLRGTQVQSVSVVPGEQEVNAVDINDRGQLLVRSSGGSTSGAFLVDGTTAEALPGLPGGAGTMYAVTLNDRGAVVGHASPGSGRDAVLWYQGVITELGPVAGSTFTMATDVNNRFQVVGNANINGISRGFIWQKGSLTLLPYLDPSAARNSNNAAAINDFGVIVGSNNTLLSDYDQRSDATVWIAGHAIALDNLIRADDPLKPYVHLDAADRINNRGDIVATGVDSRNPDARTYYFLSLSDR